MTETTVVLKAEKRQELGSSVTRRARLEGKLPAVVYGHKAGSVPVLLDNHDAVQALHHHHRVLDVDIEGKLDKCLVKDIQFDYLGDTVIHLDLMRVNINERVTVMVELALRGTPAGISEGGVLDQVNNQLEVECPAVSIPEVIKVNVAEMNIGDVINASDIELGQGVTLVTDANETIVTLKMPTEVEEPAEDEEGTATGNEPEIIGKAQEEETEE